MSVEIREAISTDPEDEGVNTSTETPQGRARPRKQRAKMGGIRSFWTGLLVFIGYALEAGVGYLANFDILTQWFAWPIAIAIGMTLYGAKRFWFPDTQW